MQAVLGGYMADIIKVKPDKDGKIFIKLFGTKYQIVVEEEKPTKKKASKEVDE